MQHAPSASIRVFVSSPTGLDEERAIVLDEIRQLSESEQQAGRPGLSVVRWPDDIAAGAADYGQAVINRQVEDSQVFLCLVGTRMGTPTPRATSGTEEEFDRAIEAAWDGQPLEILLFFSNVPVPPQNIDPYQLMLVRAFREKAARLGVLYHDVSSADDLRQLSRLSLRAAHSRILNDAATERHRLTARDKADLDSVQKEIRLGDHVFTYQRTAPQGAASFLIPFAEYKLRHVRLSGELRSESSYFRFGFKYYDSRERLYSAGSIQTPGQNVVVHTGKNTDRPEWFITRYRASYRLGADEPLQETTNWTAARFALDISPVGDITLSLNGRRVFELYFPLDGLPTVAILAWGDEHEDFVCEVRDLVLSIK